jgi:hypothetical protein
MYVDQNKRNFLELKFDFIFRPTEVRNLRLVNTNISESIGVMA